MKADDSRRGRGRWILEGERRGEWVSGVECCVGACLLVRGEAKQEWENGKLARVDDESDEEGSVLSLTTATSNSPIVSTMALHSTLPTHSS